MTTHSIETLNDQQVIENFLFTGEDNDKEIRRDEFTTDKEPTVGRGVNLFVEHNFLKVPSTLYHPIKQ